MQNAIFIDRHPGNRKCLVKQNWIDSEFEYFQWHHTKDFGISIDT